jgi:hypothetical protein
MCWPGVPDWVSILVPNEFVISKLECREANVYSSGGCFSSAISGGPVSLSATRPARLGCRCSLWKRSAEAYSFLRNAPVCSTTRTGCFRAVTTGL